MKANLHYKLLTSLTLLIFTLNTQAQSCAPLVPPITIGGVSVTSSFTGGVSSYPTAFTSCGVYTTPANSIHLGPGVFSYTLNFSAPVNCLNFILTATGMPGNEDFTFTTSSGTPSIIDNGSCFTVITGNTILSGAGAGTYGGGGDFTIVNSLPYTSLTITGSGLENGSLFAICATSVNPSPVIIEEYSSICAGDSIYLAGSYQTTTGIYYDTIVGGSFCGSDSITKFNLTVNPLPSPTITSLANLCVNAGNITLTATPSGGTFSGTGVTGTTFNPATAGASTHTITYNYTDGNGCSVSKTTNVTVNPVPSPTITSVANPCIDAGNITLTATPSGGTFSGTGVTGTTFNPASAGAGTHTITYNYTDGNGCSASTTTNVTVNPSPTFTSSKTDPTCGNNNGEIVIIPGSGSSITNYSIDNGTTTQTGGTFSSLGPGIYNIIISETNGCQATDSESLGNSNEPNIDNISSTDASCSVDDGTITITASGWATPLSYSLANGQTSTNGIFTSLADGNYTVTATDANGCVANGSVTVGMASEPTIAIVNSSDISCFGQNDGSATVNATGGTAPYTYDWSPVGGNVATATDLIPGTYTVTVKDNSGCTDQMQITISEPDEITINKTITPSVCGLDNGVISLTVTGGTGSYTYTWDSNVSTTEEATDLAIGIYKVTVTDENGCSQTISYNVPLGNPFYTEAIPDSITILQGQSTNLHLFIDPNITVDHITWTPSEGLSCSDCKDPIATPENSTTYIVTVTDKNGCISTDTVKITVILPCADIFVPNTFSPNTDGLNDLQCVFGECIVTLDFTIFNRWGEAVFHSIDQNECWDGTFRGKLVQSGVYVYKLKATLENGKKVDQTGNITVVR